MHWFSYTWFISYVCCIKISSPFSILVSGLCMLYHNFYYTLSKSGLRYSYFCSYTDIGCPLIEVSSLSKGPSRIGVSPSPEDENRSSFRNVVFSAFLEYWNMDQVQKPINSECYTPSSEYFRIY
jgi:hypothetical protein